ncbi:enoyl-CoA hydratase/isomerase family protein [Persicimonas caeni]|uniref:enoyl-CoA hydratase/isomerase family protein n=1 Tax=Persicimonas caeni TaxID=2292766 RepID=UPI00143DC46C|nr:enoyl-CoA hydratase/isomerase family protein [Persicimonas caeni]
MSQTVKQPKTIHVYRRSRGVVEVELDTPGSEVNILTGAVVGEIYELLASLDASQVSALVFTSAKPRSFINGAQLMLASAVQSADSIFELTELLRRTYRAVAEFDAPTIAAVRGSCYGCGVEFSLCCDYRIAQNGADTTFYMTEIADYLNGPAFGSTQRLPRLLGIEHAIGFLLWGHRLWGDRAQQVGLIDRVLAEESFDAEVDAFVDAIIAGKVEPRAQVRQSTEELNRVREACLDEIDRLPKDYRRLYKDCLALLLHSALKQGPLEDDDFHRELRLAGESLVEPQAEAARSFLYLRQLAERVWVRQIPKRRGWLLGADTSDQTAARFADMLDRRDVSGVRRLGAGEATSADDRVFWLTSQPGEPPRLDAEVTPVGVCLDPIGAALEWTADVVVRRPFAHAEVDHWETRVPATGTRPLVEIATTPEGTAAIAPLFEYLDAAGHSVIVSTPEDAFAADTFMAAFVAPLVAYVADGGDASAVHTSLSRFGFVPSPLAELAGEADHDALLDLVRPQLPEHLRAEASTALEALLDASHTQSTAHPELVDAVVVSLLWATRRALAGGLLRHSTLADVICRELLGFPVGHASLCEYATVERVDSLLDESDTLGRWLAEPALEDARAFVDEGRNFYL